MASERVWILEPICYDDYGIIGVFATPEAAKAHLTWLKWDEERDGEWYTRDADALGSGHYRVYSEEVRS